ncbi:MAG: hypothetical protein LBV43_08100 [Prevotella sp.]|jgi:hypothetical protein|nr:hypothetical protein [Prevotella sp.]
MKKTVLYIAFIIISVVFAACSNDDDIITDNEETDKISLIINPVANMQTKVVDDDNLASEETIKNLSIFFTEPSSTVIVDKYIHYNFRNVDDDRKLVILSLNPEVVKQKDIYIVANCDDVGMLNSYTTVSNLKNMPTPIADSLNLLVPEDGFPMFGATLNFDFTTKEVAVVNLERAVTKMRITLKFLDSTYVGTNNTFRIQKAAKYTTISSEGSLTIPTDAYYNYISDMPFNENSAQEYIAIAYLYESAEVPILNIQSFLNNEVQTFSVRLPLPLRNYLYDIEVDILPENQTTSSSLKSEAVQVVVKSKITPSRW